MKNILLISNQVFHYREKIYNNFYNRFKADGYELHVASDSFQEVGYKLTFKQHVIPMETGSYIELIEGLKPAAVIVFLHLKDKIQIPIILYCKRKHVPVIFWNKGLSVTDPHNIMKNFLYHRIHDMCDAIITYTPDMKKNFSEKNHRKLFVAYNTLDFSDIDRESYIRKKDKLKEKYGVKEDKVILYVSRMQSYKQPELLADLFGGGY